jgi:Omp85 superfamily domain
MRIQRTSQVITVANLLSVAFSVPPLPQAANAQTTNASSELAPPEFLANKTPQPDLLLKDKREGRYLTGFPAVGWGAETKFTYGASVQWFDNGPADSPFFRYTPYRQRLAIGATASTGGSSQAVIGYDLPYVNDSPWRIRAAGSFQQEKFENYFGVGESTLGPLTYPGSTLTYDNFDDYTHALERNVNGQTWERYNDYSKTRAGGVITVERDFWGGWLRPQLGFQFYHVNVKDYTGDEIDGAIMQPTRLFTDQQAGNVIGFDGGWDNAVKIGLSFDTRDFEPDPSSGVLLQSVARISSEALGSAFEYQQINFNARAYHNFLGDAGRLILAGQFDYEMQFGDVPFYSAPTIPLTDGDLYGLGGRPTLRGFVMNRFVGRNAAFVNGELRWSFGETMLWKQHLRFMLVPFVDTGRVFNSVGDTTLEDWKVDGGVGFRMAWNLSTIVSFDFGRSSEGSLFYMELGHQF